jgi:Flp pilus assembly protein TadG
MNGQGDRPHGYRIAVDERGAILPLLALVIVVLLAFAAFAVDLGAAWGERTQDQSAADAAVMAAALQYLHDEGSPSSAETITIVMDYVSRNLADPPTLAEWQSCVDDDKPDGSYVPLTDDQDPVNTYDCISLRQESDAPTRLRVRIPTRAVTTSFASIVGIETIDVSASAIAEIAYSDSARILPFSLPLNPGTEECLGVPPNGHNDGDVAPCADGSDSGNFGLLDSPWFGAGPPHGTGDVCDDKQQSYEERTEHNLAIGLDHIVKEWPHDPLPSVNADMRHFGEGIDDCTSADGDEEPFILKTETGSETGNASVFSDGMVGPGPYGVTDPSTDPSTPPQPGKIRQKGGLNDGMVGGTAGNPEFPDTINFDGADLDNVGLWQYLIGTYHGDCDFSDDQIIGRARTEQLIDCVTVSGASDEKPGFSEALLESPRYAVVPVLNYTNQTGTGYYPIVDLLPVYIQSTWYDCTNSKIGCLFHPADFPEDDPLSPDYYSTYFNPGEGEAEPCYQKKTGDPCEDPALIKLKGASAIVLDWDWLPPGAENAIGDAAPYAVQLYR